MDRKPSYYAIIPATVRYDQNLPANAKLLYGEISALCNMQGYCDLQDAQIAEPFEMSDRAVRGLIKRLAESGYILVEPIRDPETGADVGRRLSICDISPAALAKIASLKSAEGGGKSFPGGVENLFQAYIKNSNIYIPPKPPKGGECEKKTGRGYREKANCLPDRFEKFWAFYRAHVPPTATAGNKQKALKAWDKLAPSDDLASTMAKALSAQVKSKQWADGIGIPHASTWINNHCWEDVLGVAQAPEEQQPERADGDAGWV